MMMMMIMMMMEKKISESRPIVPEMESHWIKAMGSGVN